MQPLRPMPSQDIPSPSLYSSRHDDIRDHRDCNGDTRESHDAHRDYIRDALSDDQHDGLNDARHGARRRDGRRRAHRDHRARIAPMSLSAGRQRLIFWETNS